MTFAAYGYYRSPIGLIEIGCTAAGVSSLFFVEEAIRTETGHKLITQSIEQIAAYFAGSLTHFDLPLDLTGTDFQRRVWAQLLAVRFGQTASYLDIALGLDNPQAVRAVGAANGQNPVAIVVPCHRIIGSSGKLIGYGGGLWRKEWLLRHEGSLLI